MKNSLQNAPLATIARQPRDVSQSGKAGWILLWLLGIPLPVLLIIYLIVR